MGRPSGHRPWGLDALRHRPEGRGTPRRSLVVALLLACATLMVLDKGGVGHPLLDPTRQAVGEVVGPAESGVATAVRPVTDLPRLLRTRRSLDDQVAQLSAQNQQLRGRLHTSDYDRNRITELDKLTGEAQDLGYALVPAHVVGIGASQSFSDTVTIDAGSQQGLAPDLTVVDGDGLVGRVLRTTATTATVLLITDTDSVVGARVGRSMDIGFLHGRGEMGSSGRLDLDLVDQQAVPAAGDAVVTWGSRGAGPYVSGVPIGTVTSVYRSLRDSSQRARITPYVDFSSLDLVGVVVPSGTHVDGSLIEADGSIR